MAQPVANTEATYEEIEVIAHGDIRAPEPKEKWHTLANDIRLLNEVITRNPEGEGYGLKGKTWETVRGNFAAAAGLSDKPPSVQALKRRLGTLIKAKRHSLKIYKSGNEEQYDEIDKLLEEYIELEDSTNKTKEADDAATTKQKVDADFDALKTQSILNQAKAAATNRKRPRRNSESESIPSSSGDTEMLEGIFSRSSDINREKLKLRAEELAVRREEAMIARINAEANAKQVQASIEASATTNRLILELITKLLDKK